MLDRYDDYADLSRPSSLGSSPASSRRGSEFGVHTPITPISTYTYQDVFVFSGTGAPAPTPVFGSPKTLAAARPVGLSGLGATATAEAEGEGGLPCVRDLEMRLERARELEELATLLQLEERTEVSYYFIYI